MYLSLKQTIYEQLLREANQADMPLASYINQLLEQKITQQGVEHGCYGGAGSRSQQK